MTKPILAYWDIRGFAEPIRYLLHYKGVDFEDKRYVLDPVSVDVWFKGDKFKLGLDFPNLPYYIEEDLRMTHNISIIRYLAEKYGLDGSATGQKIRVSMVEQEIVQLRENYFRLCFDPAFETKKVPFLETLPTQIKLLEDFLGDKKYLAGDDITYVDFMACDLFDLLKYIAPKYINEFPKIKAYKQRMEKLPELQKYLNSKERKTWPFLGYSAPLGGSGPEPL